MINQYAVNEATKILNFYGLRRAAIENMVLQLDENTVAWELVDYLTIDGVKYFFTSMEINIAERTVTLTLAEVDGHAYDMRQVLVALK